jgi:hypothetical protein
MGALAKAARVRQRTHDRHRAIDRNRPMLRKLDKWRLDLHSYRRSAYGRNAEAIECFSASDTANFLAETSRSIRSGAPKHNRDLSQHVARTHSGVRVSVVSGYAVVTTWFRRRLLTV